MKKIVVVILCGFIFQFSLSFPDDSSLVISPSKPGNENEEVLTPSYPIIYEMAIRVNISNRYAKTLVASKVRNPEKTAKEAIFTVILPQKAFISEFVMELGGKSYVAYVKEKQEAKDIYDKAVAKGQSAAHVAASARDSNSFTVSVHIEPEAKAVFLLTYEELLERKNNQYELVLNIHPGQLVKNLNVEVNINESRPLKFVKTPSLRSGNEISEKDDKLSPSSDIQLFNSTSSVIKFTPNTEQQKQFAHSLGTKESEGLSGQFIVQYDVERDSQGGEVLLQDGYFVHFFAPKDLEPLPKYVVFVLDTSGSMHGRKMEQLKDAMNSILAEISNRDILSIVEFNSLVKVWDILSKNTSNIFDSSEENYEEPFYKLSEINLPYPVSATSENIENAKSVINSIKAMGGTHIIGGLEASLYLIKREQERNRKSTDKHQPIMIFLTDGEPTSGVTSTNKITEIVSKLNSKNDNVPIFTLSFGLGADKDFLRKMSLSNSAFSRTIYEASDASLQLQDFYKQISSPLLSNVKFTYDSGVEQVTQTSFPIFFNGSELVVTGKYQDVSFPTTVECYGPKGAVILHPTTVKSSVSSLERLWAYLTVQQMLEKRQTVENKTELTKRALDLSLKYSFVNELSSLVVVKPDNVSSVDTEDLSGRKYHDVQSFSSGSLGCYAATSKYLIIYIVFKTYLNYSYT